jgi:hypothetical protein
MSIERNYASRAAQGLFPIWRMPMCASLVLLELRLLQISRSAFLVLETLGRHQALRAVALIAPSTSKRREILMIVFHWSFLVLFPGPLWRECRLFFRASMLSTYEVTL